MNTQRQPVTTKDRFITSSSPCPICDGYDRMPRGKGRRCSGFKTPDGAYAICTREEHGGELSPIETVTGQGYKHILHGPCKCGVEHAPTQQTYQPQRSSKKISAGKEPIAIYSYHQANGRLAYEVLRYEPKDFRQRRPNNKGGYDWSMTGVTYLPYRLPALIKADPDALVYIPEGEKDTDNLIERLGVVSTTFAGGAMADKDGKPSTSKWKPEYAQHFKDRHIVLLPDNDAPGRGHVEVVSKALKGIAASITILALPNLPEKGDVSDWIDAGGTREQLEQLARAPQEPPAKKGLAESLASQDMEAIFDCASEFAALPREASAYLKLQIKRTFGASFPMREFDDVIRIEAERFAKENRRKPNIISAKALMSKQFAPKQWVIPGILPAGLIALAGKQKIGKSWLDYNFALAVASGGVALGNVRVEQGDVLYLALEDNEQRLQDRIKQLLAPGQEVPDRMDIVTEWPYRMDADGIALLDEWIQSKEHPRLIIIDPWVKVKPRVKQRQGETGYDADYEALEGLKRLSDKYDLTILVQFHLRKAGAEDPFDELNGTSGITACADGFLSLKRSRGESDATLWGTGRDYKEDVDLALAFNAGYWRILGNAAMYQLTKESKEVIDALNDAGKPLQPAELALLLGLSSGTIRKRLMDMKKREEVKDTGNGYIAIIGNEGNSGNASNSSNAGNAVTVQAQPVTENAGRYQGSNASVTALRPLQKPRDEVPVTGVTTVTTNTQNNASVTDNDDTEIEEFVI